MAPLTIRAAGGVVWRQGDGGPEVLLIHRPRYDDWSLPKGKLGADESDEDCARREVTEETGLECVLGPELPSTRYRDRKGRDKLVRYWAMAAGPGRFTPHEEVDEIRWVALDQVARHLSYSHDAKVVAALPEAVGLAEGAGLEEQASWP